MLKIVIGIFIVLFVISIVLFIYEALKAPILDDYEEKV